MSESPNLAKTRRQKMVADLIRSGSASNQSEFVALLVEAGLDVTQATVSRDLRELGAVKTQRGYSLPGEAAIALPEARIHRLLAEWVESVEAAGNSIVLRTPPASAHMVASALDHAGWPEIAGTIAGDDTLLVIVRDGHDVAALAERIAAITDGKGGLSS